MPFTKGHRLSVGKGRGTLADEQVKRFVIRKAWEKKSKKMSDNDATQIVVKDMTQKVGGDNENPIIVKIEKEIADKNANPQSKPNSE